MTVRFTRAITIGAGAHGLLLVPPAAWAHHSFAAESDTRKPVELKGTVTSIDSVNPHAWIHLDVKDEAGRITGWNRELGSPNLLMCNGGRKFDQAGGTASSSAARPPRTARIGPMPGPSEPRMGGESSTPARRVIPARRARRAMTPNAASTSPSSAPHRSRARLS